MEQFLRYIERRAFHFVRISVGNIEDATIQIRFKFECDGCGVNGSYLSPGEYQNLVLKEVSGNSAWAISVHGDSEFPNQTAVGSWFTDGRTHAPIENNTWYDISITRDSSSGLVQLYLKDYELE